MSIQQLNEDAGAEFIISCARLAERFKEIRGFVFDWDGVFNSGTKGENSSSTYTEADSMGLNMLRFCCWLNQRRLPFTAIITGQKNHSAFQLAQREHFSAVYFGFSDKIAAFRHIESNFHLHPQELAFTFDDILDLSAAVICKLRFLVRRAESPQFINYVKERQLCDYISAFDGAHHAVREICDLILGASGMFETVLDERIAFSESYRQYLDERTAVETKYYQRYADDIVKFEYQ